MIKKITFLFLPLLAFLYILPLFSQVHASKVVYSDDFNDNILDNWSEKRNMQWSNPGLKCKNLSQDASWKIENGKAGIRINGPGCVTELTPDDFSLSGINNFSLTLDLLMPVSVNVDRNFVIRYIDPNNWIGIHLIDNRVYFQKYINGIPYFSTSYEANYSFQPNQTYKFESILLNDNTVKILINGTEVLNFVDQEPFVHNGTIGLQASVGAIPASQVFFDNIVVKDLDQVDLEVPFFSQNDPNWGANEYDSASNYSWGEDDPSIDGWGCYMTSAAMMLRYHGHTTLPDATNLTPQTLNEWLLDFDDKIDGKGYVNEGNTNPLAITRLTELNNEINDSLPKFEYKKKNVDDEFLKNELKEERPVMLQVTSTFGTHFVVAKGIDSNGKIIINDPEATQSGTLLDKYNNQYVSMRTYTPTHSDLSYFMFIPSSPDLQFVLKDENGNTIPLEIVMDDAIAHQTIPGLKQSEKKVWGIPKPETGNYTLEITSLQSGNFTIETHVYNKKAEPDIFETTGFFGEAPKIFTIQFDKERSEQIIEEEIGFAQFIQDLDLMWELGHFKRQSAYTALRTRAVVAQNASPRFAKIALAKSIETSLKLTSTSSLSVEGKNYLLQRIRAVISNL